MSYSYLIHQQNCVLIYGCHELQQNDNSAQDFDDTFLDVPHVSLILLNAHDIDLLKNKQKFNDLFANILNVI